MAALLASPDAMRTTLVMTAHSLPRSVIDGRRPLRARRPRLRRSHRRRGSSASRARHPGHGRISEPGNGGFPTLLDLIRKQQIDIYDIPIASITQQYLEYMQRALEMDIELSAEFVYMAATLIHIKSRMLLPRDPELEKMSPEDDPRQELVDRLLEHERFKNAAEMLQQKRMIEEAVWSNPQIEPVSLRRRRSRPGGHAVRSGEDVSDGSGARQEPARSTRSAKRTSASRT